MHHKTIQRQQTRFAAEACLFLTLQLVWAQTSLVGVAGDNSTTTTQTLAVSPSQHNSTDMHYSSLYYLVLDVISPQGLNAHDSMT